MSRSKMVLNMFLRKFSGFLVLIVLGVVASVASGDFKSAFKIIVDFKLIILLLIILVLIVVYRPIIKGFLGEKSVQFFLSKLDKSKYTVLNDIMIDVSGKTTQIDHLVVSNYGIFVIETKNYKGWIIGDEYSEYWTQVIFKRKETLYNPIRQNYGHIMALKEHLKDYSNVPIYSIISFSLNADLKVKTITPVVYSTNLNNTISNYKDEVVSDTDKVSIINLLKSINIRGRGARGKHVSAIHEKKADVQIKINRNICPKCGSVLIQRKGKYGLFTGCSGYPKCKYIVKDKILSN